MKWDGERHITHEVLRDRPTSSSNGPDNPKAESPSAAQWHTLSDLTTVADRHLLRLFRIWQLWQQHLRQPWPRHEMV